LTRDQFVRESPHRLNIGRCPPSVDLDVAALRPAKLSEFRPQRRDPGLRFMVALGKGHQDADASHWLGLLRACRERPSRCAAEKANELTSPHIRTQAQGTVLYRLKRVL
jgi:hypothetical protein